MDYFKTYSAELDCFETPIKTQHGWTVLRPESIESIDMRLMIRT